MANSRSKIGSGQPQDVIEVLLVCYWYSYDSFGNCQLCSTKPVKFAVKKVSKFLEDVEMHGWSPIGNVLWTFPVTP